MDKELIKKTEEGLEKYLFGKIKVTDIGLKRADVTIKYLIYYYLKEMWLKLLDINDNLLIIHNELKTIKEKLTSIDETLFDMTNSGIYENKNG